MRRDFHVSGISHITGGGLRDNLPRILPKQCKAVVHMSSWTPPPVFLYLGEAARISAQEMLRTFNCGLGLVMVVRQEETTEALLRLQAMGETAYHVGSIEPREGNEEAVEFVT
jgi:phosphoribosylformylglycinamidine cyclo-ligase